MIGVDTNILVRAALDDDPKEASVAKFFLKKAAHEKKLFVSSYAILEMVWVLKIKNRTRQEITEAIVDLLDSPGVTVGHRDVIVAALEKYSKGKADFGDYVILAEGEAEGAPRLATFDKVLTKDDSHCEHPANFF